MKRSILILLLFLTFAACKSDNKSEETQLKNEENKENLKPRVSLLTEGKVGHFSIGDKMPGATRRYSMETVTQTRPVEGGEITETYYILYADPGKDGKKHLILKYGHDEEGRTENIGEIMVLHGEYQTEEGIGVGSSLQEFIQAYPDYKIWYTYVSDRYIIQHSKSSIQFLLDEKGFIGEKQINSEMTPLKASDFKENTKIEKIRVYK